jgi:uncharacterized protein (TIGR02145 family)
MKLLSLSALLAVLFLSSCSKKDTPAPATNPNVGTVVIGGVNYATIIIGKQTWTSVNYVGAGGVSAGTDASLGNYYTLAASKLVSLPAGWRIPARADYNNLLSNFTSQKNSDGDYVGDVTVAQALADSTKFALISATNSSGFGAYAAGYYDPVANKVVNLYFTGTYLTSTTATQGSSTLYYFFAINNDGVSLGSSNSYFAGIDYFQTTYGYSLRFVKDN